MVSTAQMSPFGVAIMPCIWLSPPPKFQPSGGDNGLPVLSNSVMSRPVKLSTQTWSCASMVNPKPGPARPPPLKPNGLGDRGLPLGANLLSVPVHDASWFWAPTMKLLASQTFPSLSNISLPGALNPPPANLRGNIHALGANVKYGKNGVWRKTLPGVNCGCGYR